MKALAIDCKGNKVGAFTPEDVDLMGNLNQKVTDAEERMKAKRFEEAQTLMQDAMEAHGSATLFLQSQYGKFAGRTDKLLGDIKRKIAAMNRSGEWE